MSLNPESSGVERKVMHAMKAVGNKPRWKGRLVNALVAVVALAIFMEGGFRLILSINALRQRALGFDSASWRLQWVKLHSYHAEWAWTGPFATYHPTRGWAVKPGIQNMDVMDGMILNTNSRGLRGTTEYRYQRTPGKQRILVLGDSFTFGSEVADDETFSHHLEAGLPHTEVLNMGVQGYGHDQMLLYLKEEGVKYHPDIVIVGFVYPDIYRSIWRFFAYAKPKFDLVSGDLQLTNVPVPTPVQVLAMERYRPKALDFLVILQDKLRWAFGQNEREARSLTKALLNEIVATTRGIGAVPVFVYFPVYEEIEPHAHGRSYPLTANSPPIADRERYFKSICQDERIHCLFLRPRFDEEVKRGVDLHPKGHWNAAAHSLAAQEMQNFLVANGLVQKDAVNLQTHVGQD